MAREADDDADEYSSGPAQILVDAGFDQGQADALVEAMRACYEEETEGKPARPMSGGNGGGRGPDLTVVFGSTKPGKRK